MVLVVFRHERLFQQDPVTWHGVCGGSETVFVEEAGGGSAACGESGGEVGPGGAGVGAFLDAIGFGGGGGPGDGASAENGVVSDGDGGGGGAGQVFHHDVVEDD